MAAWREKGYRILLLSGGEARGRRLRESLEELGEKADYVENPGQAEDIPHPGKGRPVILPLTLSRGFVLPGSGLAMVSDADIWEKGTGKAGAESTAGKKSLPSRI